jgi:hypothetical protein
LEIAPDVKPIVTTWFASVGALMTIVCCTPTTPLGVAIKPEAACAGPETMNPDPSTSRAAAERDASRERRYMASPFGERCY